MMTIHEVSRLAGVSVRALRYYDKIGLLAPTGRTEAGYRLYDEAALERLQHILLFRELEFPLLEIREIIARPDFDRDRALAQQIDLLTLKKQRLEALIDLARGMRTMGKDRDLTAFSTDKLKEYAARARAAWGDTPAYREYAEKTAGRAPGREQQLAVQMMALFAQFGAMKEEDPASPAAQALVGRLQAFINEHFYRCTDEILAGLGKMYAAGGEFTANIDKAGGAGTAVFASRAIAVYCRS